MKRSAFFISDGTGITVESLGRSLLTQFDDFDFELNTIPFVNDLEKAQLSLSRIRHTYLRANQKPLVFITIANPAISNIMHQADGVLLDIFAAFINPLERELQCRSSHRSGLTHAQRNFHDYHKRIKAINFAQANDDGGNIKNYAKADVIIVGASRSGKTPTSLYLALNYGIKAANYPFTEDDLPLKKLPDFLETQKDKLFGLSIAPEHLSNIRSERRANSQYASLKQCQYEISQIEQLYQRENIPCLDTTSRSIEEISAKIKEWCD